MYKPARSMEITTQIGCSLMCSYCPQDKLQKAWKDPRRVMSMDTFVTCLNRLPQDVAIIFAGLTEPWSNKNCNDFLEYALRQGREVTIYTTLAVLSESAMHKLVDLTKTYTNQIKQFCVHLPDSQGNMIGFRYSNTYELALQEFRKISGLPYSEMTMDSKNQVDPRIKISTKPVGWYLHTRAGNLNIDQIQNQSVNPMAHNEFIIECTRNKLLTANILLPNGDVTLCCMDYGLKHILGNLLNQEYEEIIAGNEIDQIRQSNQQWGFSTDTLCRTCNDAHCRTPWNDEEIYQRALKEHPEMLGIGI